MAAYARFLAMIATSMLCMYLLTYANVWTIDHATVSESRIYMVLYMGAVMAVVMLGFMWGMYPGRGRYAILAGAALLFATGLWLMRSQATVGDVSWMRAMIPHHSIAILTSERAGIEDPRVRALADEIIEAQRREIAEMQALIADLTAAAAAGRRAP